MTIQIIVDDVAIRDVERRLNQFADKAPNAIARALNRSVSNVRANITKEVRNDYHIKAGDVRKTLKDFKANRNKLVASVKSSGGVIGLDHFKVSPKTVNPNRKSQLKIATKKDGVKQILGAFIADVNGVKVFNRTGEEKVRATKGRYANRPNVKREPIARKFGPSVPQMLGNEEVANRIKQKSHETYENRLTHEIEYILSRI